MVNANDASSWTGPRANRTRPWLATLALGVSLWCADGRAQDDAALSRARVLFAGGMDAAERGDWEAARQAFEDAYALVPRPRLLLNLASARIRTGQLVQGAADLRAFIESAGPEDRALVTEARAQLAEVEGRIPRLTVRLSGDPAGVRVSLDGELLSAASLRAPIPVDPGPHELVLTRDGERVAFRELGLEDGRAREVTLSVPAEEPALPEPTPAPAEPELAIDAAPPEPPGDDSLPLVLGVTLGVAAAALVGVLVGLFAAQPFGGGPYTGNVSPGRVGLP